MWAITRFVDDLVRGYVLAMEKGRIGERYILGGENVSLKGFFALVDEATGRRHRQISLPPWAALAFARLEELKARWFGIYPADHPGLGGDFSRRLGLLLRQSGAGTGLHHHPAERGYPRHVRVAARATGRRQMSGKSLSHLLARPVQRRGSKAHGDSAAGAAASHHVQILRLQSRFTCLNWRTSLFCSMTRPGPPSCGTSARHSC